MPQHLLKETAVEYRRRWHAVHEAEIEEIRQPASRLLSASEKKASNGRAAHLEGVIREEFPIGVAGEFL